jgi:hypothetical protein
MVDKKISQEPSRIFSKKKKRAKSNQQKILKLMFNLYHNPTEMHFLRFLLKNFKDTKANTKIMLDKNQKRAKQEMKWLLIQAKE